jgi:putative transposase
VAVPLLKHTLSHKIRLTPNRHQQEYFKKACGVSRFTWNWGLSRWQEIYKKGGKPNALKLKKQFNAIKREDYPWTYEVTKYASQQAFIHLQAAFQRFFEKQSRFPRYKKKGVRDSFYVGGDQVQVNGKRIRIPKLGWIRMRESLRFSGKLHSATVSRGADHWYVSLSVELSEKPKPCESQEDIGVDLGINRLATLSNGNMFNGPKPLKRKLKKLRRCSRRMSRKKKDSKNREKARVKLARHHLHIRNIRQDALHKLTTHITQNFSEIAIEDLNVKGMMRNRRLARAIVDMGFHEFRRQLIYKANLRGCHVVVVDRWFPSSKLCSRCSVIKENLPLGERMFRCDACGLVVDRDLNAARNIALIVFDFLITVSSTGFQARGEASAGSGMCVSETGLYEAGTGT